MMPAAASAPNVSNGSVGTANAGSEVQVVYEKINRVATGLSEASLMTLRLALRNSGETVKSEPQDEYEPTIINELPGTSLSVPGISYEYNPTPIATTSNGLNYVSGSSSYIT